MRRANAKLLAGACAGAVAAMLAVAAAVRPPGPAEAGPLPVVPPPVMTSVATTATAAPAPELPAGAQLAGLVPGKVSVLVHDRKTGRDLVSHRPDATYPAAALAELLIALEALRQGEPAGAVAEMLSRGDDAIASRWWAELGGPAIVSGWAARIGMTSTRPPADPGQWGRTLVTAADLARFYRYLLDDAPVATRQIVLRALDSTARRAADGSAQLFGVPAAVTATDWAVKQGWSCCEPDRVLHTSGVVADRRYVVVVLTAQPAATGWPDGTQRVTAVVKALSRPFGWS